MKITSIPALMRDLKLSAYRLSSVIDEDRLFVNEFRFDENNDKHVVIEKDGKYRLMHVTRKRRVTRHSKSTTTK